MDSGTPSVADEFEFSTFLNIRRNKLNATRAVLLERGSVQKSLRLNKSGRFAGILTVIEAETNFCFWGKVEISGSITEPIEFRPMGGIVLHAGDSIEFSVMEEFRPVRNILKAFDLVLVSSKGVVEKKLAGGESFLIRCMHLPWLLVYLDLPFNYAQLETKSLVDFLANSELVSATALKKKNSVKLWDIVSFEPDVPKFRNPESGDAALRRVKIINVLGEDKKIRDIYQQSSNEENESKEKLRVSRIAPNFQSSSLTIITAKGPSGQGFLPGRGKPVEPASE